MNRWNKIKEVKIVNGVFIRSTGKKKVRTKRQGRVMLSRDLFIIFINF